jgi:hypothetical protein
MNGEFVYTKDGEIFLPENKIEKPEPSYQYEALRGRGLHLAVYCHVKASYVGWIDTRTLGFETAKDWLLSVSGVK